MGVFQQFRCLFCGDFAVLAHFLIIASRRAVGAETTRNNADKGTVHRLTHNVRKDSPRRTDQRTGHNQQVVAEHKARSRSRPAGVRVQHRHHHWHICTTDGGD
ncbi:Uncharacterised protein [Shigella sonnei]|nr:Uncharacterised protein [Shigella sonnei]CSQ74787.1 Uncharacterised protein [Shigella sonnei]